MTTFLAVAPIYERLGFTFRVWEGGDYAFATRDEVELHLGVVPAERIARSSAYLFVDDADALAATWQAAGVDVRTPEDTPWRMREAAVIDPDDNVIRFGSPLQ